MAGLLVRGTVLDATTYQRALSEADAYDRVYTDVLTDPELIEAQENLLGSVTPEGLDAADARALTGNALRWALPPDRLQAGTDQLIDAIVAYLRGDVERLDGLVSISDVVDRVETTSVNYLRSALAHVETRAIDTSAAYADAVDAFARDIADGRLPSAIPVLIATKLSESEVADVVAAQVATRASDATADDADVALLAGDQRAVMTIVASEVVAGVAQRASDRLRADLVDGSTFDVVAELADRADERQAEIVDGINGVRDLARLFGWPIIVVGLILVAVGVALVARLAGWNRGSWICVALAFAGAAAMFVVGWLVVVAVTEAPLDAATATDANAWGLPSGLRLLLVDVVVELGSEIRAAIVRLVVLSVVIAAMLTLVAIVASMQRTSVRIRRPIVALGVAIAIAGVWVGVRPAAASPRACNGETVLCDRPYDEVVFAATHNSMSSPGRVEIWPEHDLDIRAQLDSGVRALLIDTHYWPALGSERDLEAADPTVAARVRSRVYESLGDRRTGREGTYLCHNHCAYGATKFVDALGDVAQFLDDNPDDVVTLIIQDAISPDDTVAAFRAADLIDRVHTHAAGSEWATLGELIERDERLVVFAEEQGSDPAWYHAVFDYAQETPYHFESPDDFSCEENRGPADASLFLMNHWIQRLTPDRADAVVVNQRDVLVARARQCEAERGQLPNFVAVNFSSIGDLIGAVDELNRIE